MPAKFGFKSLVPVKKEVCMARIEDTAGNIVITIDTCDCGLTSGCDECRPIIIPKQALLREIREKSHRELGVAWQYLAYH